VPPSPKPTRRPTPKPQSARPVRDPRAPSEHPPPDFRAALDSSPEALEGWEELPPSRKRELIGAIEEAGRPATRARRIEQVVGLITSYFRGAPRSRKRPRRTPAGA